MSQQKKWQRRNELYYYDYDYYGYYYYYYDYDYYDYYYYYWSGRAMADDYRWPSQPTVWVLASGTRVEGVVEEELKSSNSV